ncbi:MAG: UDP-N-acetylglucosamine 2-epimerase (non-hydrolyzing) [Solirubrobacterales bacterium]|nr:UDP-N-acetylglucosamine 2-epimerase (non-hydrolyzing) [Solirubrobacterales bacterium]
MKVLSVIGNRPQFIKAAAVSPRLREVADEVLIHTGQHFDDELSSVFFAELGIPAPERELGIALGTNTSQTARMLAALEPVIASELPDVVLVYGDTNSTLAGALAAAQAGRPVAHVEAGMRSFDRSMPEELNRILSDHASSLLLCSSPVAVENLQREAVGGAVELVGDVMVDVALSVQPAARPRLDLLAARGVTPGEYVLATAHRAGNVDDPARLARLVELLLAVPLPVVLPLHPRTEARLRAAGRLDELAAAPEMILTPPLGYIELTALLCNARAALTDSGGLQKEAYLAGVKCITLRPSTEWVETVEQGWNTLVDLDRDAMLTALDRDPPLERPPLYGDGRAGERVVQSLRDHAAAHA